MSTKKKASKKKQQQKPVKSVLVKRLAVNLNKIRGDKTQREVATKIGISVSYLSMLEHGQRSPQLEMVEKIAKALRVKDPADLLRA